MHFTSTSLKRLIRSRTDACCKTYEAYGIRGESLSVNIENVLPEILLSCLFVLRLNVPVNNFSVMSGRSHRFLGKPVLSGSKVSCSRTQHGGGRFRAPDLSLRSPTLYHWATALPRYCCRLTVYICVHCFPFVPHAERSSQYVSGLQNKATPRRKVL